MTTYVIAGESGQYRDWVAERGLLRHEVCNLRTTLHVTGLVFGSDDKLELVGTWWRRPDLRQIVGQVEISVHKSRDRPAGVADVIEPLLADWRNSS